MSNADKADRANDEPTPTPFAGESPQNESGSAAKMLHEPDSGADSYVGHGRLEGKVALITALPGAGSLEQRGTVSIQHAAQTVGNFSFDHLFIYVDSCRSHCSRPWTSRVVIWIAE